LILKKDENQSMTKENSCKNLERNKKNHNDESTSKPRLSGRRLTVTINEI
jgi:hypothetical protein